MSVAKFDLTLGLGERRGPEGEPLGIEGELEYSQDLFEPGTAEAMAGRFVSAVGRGGRVTRFAAAPVGGHRRRRAGHALQVYNSTERPVPVDGRGVFEAQAARTPDAVASFSATRN